MHDNFQKANNIGADQTAHMRSLVCAFVVCNPPKTNCLVSRLNIISFVYPFNRESYSTTHVKIN